MATGRYSLYLQPRGRTHEDDDTWFVWNHQRLSWLTDGDDLPALLATAEQLFAMKGTREVSVRENGVGDAAPFGSVTVLRLTRHDVTDTVTRTWGSGEGAVTVEATVGDGAAGEGGRHRRGDHEKSGRDALADVIPLVARLAGASARELEGWPAELGAALRAIFQN